MTSNNKDFKLLIIGDAQHGKDTVAGIINDLYGLTFESSSVAALRIFLFDVLNNEYNKGYSTLEEAYNDRVSEENRIIWYNEIVKYNTSDKSRLAREILKTSDIYIGMRNIDELLESKYLFNYIIGVYNNRVPKENKKSNSIDIFEHSDIIVTNNTDLQSLELRLTLLNV